MHQVSGDIGELLVGAPGEWCYRSIIGCHQVSGVIGELLVGAPGKLLYRKIIGCCTR